METNNEPNIIPPQPNKNWFLRHEFLYSVIAVLILVVLVGSAYWWQTIKQTNQALTKVDSANLKTYSTKDFDIKIPNDWTELKPSKYSGHVLDLVSSAHLQSADKNFNNCNGKGNYADCPENYISYDLTFYTGSAIFKDTKVSTVSINGLTFKKYIHPNDGDMVYETERDDVVYEFNFPSENEAIIKQILATLKFNSSVDSVQSKSYKSDCLQFEYPRSYTSELGKCVISHDLVRGKDLYGFGAVTLDSTLQTGYSVSITRFPLDGETFDTLFKSIEDGFNRSKSLPEDSMTKITVDGQQAVRVYLPGIDKSDTGRLMTDTISFIDNGYSYEFQLMGTGLATTAQETRLIKDFENMVKNFKALDNQ